MKNLRVLNFLCVVLLVVLVCLGLELASGRPLWNDEINSQVSSIRPVSYAGILAGRIEEGNNSPLFYMIQKGICDLSGYDTPKAWIEGKWSRRDPRSEVLLRISPVVFMSLAVVAIFYFFSRFYSVWAGLLSLFVSLSSYMVWAYWAEARPYALWVFLTALQALLFLFLTTEHGRKDSRAWLWLSVVNIAMALTTVFSLVQVPIVSALLWLFTKQGRRRYLLLTLVPVVIGIFYYIHASKYQFWFSLTPEQLVRECFSRDRFYILFIFMFFWGLYFFQKKTGFPKLFKDDHLKKGYPCVCLTALMLGAAFLLLGMLVLGDTQGEAGFAVSSRYFIFLTPVGIISTTLLTCVVIRALRGAWWVALVPVAGIGYLLVYRMLRLMPAIKGLYPEYFS